MRVVVIGPVPPVRGGIAQHTIELCEQLNKKHSVTIFSLERLYQSFVHKLLYKGNSTVDVPPETLKVEKKKTLSINPLTWVSSALQIRKLKPDYVFFTWADPYLFPLLLTIKAALPNKTKIVLLCHELSPPEGRFFENAFNTAAFKLAGTIVAHSHEGASRIRQLSRNAKVVPLFLPLSDFPAGISQHAAKRQLGLKDFVILFFGYVRPYKGLMYLVEALPEVLKKKKATLLIAGEFWEDRNKYLEQIRKLGLEKHVKIIDRYIPDAEMPIYFSAADVVAAPYVTVSQSAVVTTAYAFNKPVVATDTGGLSETVKDGVTGYLVKPCNSKALADALLKFDKKDFDTKNIRRVKTKYSWDSFCTHLMNGIQ